MGEMGGSEPEQQAGKRISPDRSMQDDPTRMQRQEALAQLAHTQFAPHDAAGRELADTSGSPAPRGSLRPGKYRSRRRSLRRIIALVGLVCAVLLAAIAAYYAHNRVLVSLQVPSALTLTPQENGLDCLQAAAWSPHAEGLAVLGFDQGCSMANSLQFTPYPTHGVLDVYDTTTGTLRSQYQLGKLIIPHLHVSIPTAVSTYLSQQHDDPALAYTVIYSGISWSPDGDRIAIPFDVQVYTGPPIQPPDGGLLNWPGSVGAIAGLFVITSSGGTQVLPDQPGVAVTRTWDLATGQHVSDLIAIPTQGSVPTTPLPVAYRWTAGDVLVPVPPAAGMAPEATPIGTPDGGSAFTIWQSGQIATVLSGNGPFPSLVPGVVTWSPTFTVWSPDGRYVMDSYSVGAAFLLADATSAAAATYAPFAVPIRDAALRTLVSKLDTSASGGPQQQSAALAWRPDGRLLAARSTTTTGADTDPKTREVTLYDCRTGRQVATLTPGAGAAHGGDSWYTTVLEWSPDGSRLLYADPLLKTITIWGPSVLPH